jgi:hypothetical protein
MAFSLDYPTLESAEQDRPDKRERGDHRQRIQPQGKVHVRPPSLLRMTKSSRNPARTEGPNVVQRRRSRQPIEG